MNLLKLMHKTGVDRMQVSLINGEPHPAIVALADELEAHWKKTVTERDEYAQELRDQVEKLAEECVVLRASSRSKLETISSLELQVEKLTKERDTEIARNRPLQALIKSQEEIKSFLLKKSEENKEAVKQLDSERQANAVLTEELAALAEQNAKMTKPKFGRDGLMAIAAFRYCLGRMTYIVYDCADWLIEQWPILPENVKNVIKRDLDAEIKADDEARAEGREYKPLGHDCDRASWLKVRKMFEDVI